MTTEFSSLFIKFLPRLTASRQKIVARGFEPRDRPDACRVLASHAPKTRPNRFFSGCVVWFEGLDVAAGKVMRPGSVADLVWLNLVEWQYTESMIRPRAIVALLLIIVGIFLACNYRKAPQTPPKNPTEERTATINLSAAINASPTEVFHEAKQASRLPSAVLDKLRGVADPGQPFNCTCIRDPKLPMAGLVVAAVSEKYCIVTYWSGTIVCGMKTSIFELREGRVKRTWVSGGGGFNFLDLKTSKRPWS